MGGSNWSDGLCERENRMTRQSTGECGLGTRPRGSNSKGGKNEWMEIFIFFFLRTIYSGFRTQVLPLIELVIIWEGNERKDGYVCVK